MSQRLVMLGVDLNDLFEMSKCLILIFFFRLFCILVENFSKAKIGTHRIHINLESMIIIFNGSLLFREICKQIGKVNTGAKMILVQL